MTKAQLEAELRAERQRANDAVKLAESKMRAYSELIAFTEAHVGRCLEPGCIGMRDHEQLGWMHQSKGEAQSSGAVTVRCWGSVSTERPFERDRYSGKLLSSFSVEELRQYHARENEHAGRDERVARYRAEKARSEREPK